MKKNMFLAVLLLVISSSMFTSCQAIGDIFKAGVWVGVIVVIAVVGLVLWLISKMSK